jgi:tripartite-type tricarboxylate transporter receptor subunit TctC
MIRTRMRLAVAGTVLACCAATAGCSSLSQNAEGGGEYPGDQPVTFLMPYTAGGSSDLLIRALQPYFSEALGTEIVVENKVGAGGQVALTELANAATDGHTIGLTNLPSTLAYVDPDKKASYSKDSFQPIGAVNRFRGIVATSPANGWNDLQTFVNEAKSKPGALTVGVDGLTGDDHIAALKFMQATGTDLKVVPFDSGSEKLIALVGGEIDVSLGTVPTFKSQLDTGEVRALAALEEEPIPGLENVPTARSLGYDLLWDSYNVVTAPAGLEPEVQQKLEDALRQASEAAAADPAFVDKMEAGGYVFTYEDAAWVEQTWSSLESQWKELVPQARQQGQGR